MYDYPKRPEGPAQAQVQALWEALFRLVEQLNVKEQEDEA